MELDVRGVSKSRRETFRQPTGVCYRPITMRRLSLAVAFLLSQAAPAPQSQPGSVAGTVVNQATNEPLSKVTVTIYPATLYPAEGNRGVYQSSSTTDADGKYVFPAVPPGQYRISATRANYVRAEYGDRGSNGCGTPLQLIAGQRVTGARIAMMPAGVISGRLHDADREGMPGVSAHALKYVYENGRRVLIVAQTVQTNDRGDYRLFGLAPGRYYVAAALESVDPTLRLIENGQQTTIFTPQEWSARFLPAYFPGVADPLAARAIELRPAEEVPGVDLMVTSTRTVPILGKIVNSSSREVPQSLTVNLLPRLAHPNAGRPLRTSKISADGTFTISDALPGAYFLVASTDAVNGRLAGLASIDVGNSDHHAAVLELSPAFDLSGRVAVDDPKVMERILVVSWRSVNPALALTSSFISAPVNQADGSFKLQGVTPGDYLPFLTFKAPGDIYLKAIRLGSLDVRDGVHLDGPPAQQLELVAGANGAIVEGTVVNDKQQPVAGVSVVLVPDVYLRKRPTLYKFTTTDAAGAFRIQAIAPGDYKLFAWEEVEQGAWQDPDFLRIHETRGKAVTLREGTAERLQISPIPSTGPIYGQCPNPLAIVR
jgi:protocatechuate 3,4-dioxygenase beta subunit